MENDIAAWYDVQKLVTYAMDNLLLQNIPVQIIMQITIYNVAT